MLPEQVVGFFEALKREDPNPQTELYYKDPFTLLVAVVLSAQATDKGVNKATEPLFERADTPQKILDLGEEGLRDAIKSIGLYKTKATNIMKLCRALMNHHGGEVPKTREALEALAGVGRKTANVVLNVAFKEPTMPVDTHIFRIGNRTGLAPGNTPLEVEKGLLEVIPEEFMDHAHHWLILLGRYTCKARKPECDRCVVRPFCSFEGKI